MGMAPKNDPRNVQQIQRLNMNYFVSIEIHLSQTPGLRIHPWPDSGKKNTTEPDDRKLISYVHRKMVCLVVFTDLHIYVFTCL